MKAWNEPVVLAILREELDSESHSGARNERIRYQQPVTEAAGLEQIRRGA